MKMAIIVASLIGFALLNSTGRADDTAVEESYRLALGDKVRVTVYGHEDLSGEFELDGAGRISLPLISDINASGMGVTELEEAIVNKLKPDYLKNPSVSVDILNYGPIYVIGEVKSPGSYPYINGMTVLSAVAVAGGYTYRAHKRKIKIVRGDVDDKKINAKPDTPILPGDVVEVPQRLF